jgi:DNA modification methylase
VTATVIQADTLNLPLADNSVDLIVTSPPYFGLRSYQDGGEHYAGQVGAEATPAEYIDALIACTREWVRVLTPAGSIFVNLGDKYAGGSTGGAPSSSSTLRGNGHVGGGPKQQAGAGRTAVRIPSGGTPTKSLMLLPERYRIAAVDQLGLIARAVIIWSKPNGLPESVTDRVRRSHEDWVHLTVQPRYYSAVDAIRDGYADATAARYASGYAPNKRVAAGAFTNATQRSISNGDTGPTGTNPLGKLPGSVRTVATQPLRVPEWLGVDHFAAFPTAWPRWIIAGWSPREVCTVCGQGRRPVSERTAHGDTNVGTGGRDPSWQAINRGQWQEGVTRTITGWSCDCPDTSAPTTPGVVLDPFGGTGTTALVADVLGRTGISVDLSHDYCRLARWRTTDPGERARAAEMDKPPVVDVHTEALFEVSA